MLQSGIQNNYFKLALVLSGAVFVICAAFANLILVKPAQAATVTPRVEVTGSPGKTVVTALKITNEERQSKTYYTDIQNFESQDESGNPHFTTRKEDLSTWVSVQESVTVGPGQTVEVPISIAIPSQVDPGGHFAAVFFQTTPPNTDSGSVALSAKLGTLILLRVNGDFVQDATILEFGAKDKKRIFSQLPIYFYYRFQNVGDDHLKPVGDVLITNMIGRLSKILPANPVDGSVLPKSVRRFETVWATSGKPIEQGLNPQIVQPNGSGFFNAVKYQWNNFTFGKYTATLKVVYGTKELKSEKVKYTFWVIPWQLTLVTLIALVIIIVCGRFGLKRYNRYIISKAQFSSTKSRQPRSRIKR